MTTSESIPMSVSESRVSRRIHWLIPGYWVIRIWVKYQQTRFPSSASAIKRNSGSNFSWNDAAAAQAAVCEEVPCLKKLLGG